MSSFGIVVAMTMGRISLRGSVGNHGSQPYHSALPRLGQH